MLLRVGGGIVALSAFFIFLLFFIFFPLHICLYLVYDVHNKYLYKNRSVYIQCKGDIVVVDINTTNHNLKNSNFTITQSAKFF